MLCYGLLVYPRGFWENNIDFDTLNEYVSEETNENIINLFEVMQNEIEKEINIKNLFKHLRNSISHSRVEIDFNKNIFTFIDINPNSSKVFSVSIEGIKLVLFLKGIGRYFTKLDQINL